MKRITALLLSVLLLAAGLCSCSAGSGEIVMEYDGIKLYENMYGYFVSTFKRNIMNNYTDARDSDFWDKEYTEGTTVEEYFGDISESQLKYYLICQSLAKQNGIKLEKSVTDAVNEDINEKIEYAGGRGALNSELAELGIDIDALRECYLWEKTYDAVFDWYYGTDGAEKVTAEQMLTYYRENYSHIQYIVFYKEKLVTDEKGNYIYDASGTAKTEPLSEDEMTEMKARKDSCLERAKGGEDFIELMKEFSDQPTNESYPNGFFLSLAETDVWGSEIATKTLAANVGDVLEVEEENCFFIIKKEQLTPLHELSDTDLGQIPDIENNLASELFRKKLDSMKDGVTVNEEIKKKYRLREVKSNPFYSY